MLQKRYQHYTRKPDGSIAIEFTEWFDTRGNDEDLKSIQKENKWQLKNKLLNEYRIKPIGT